MARPGLSDHRKFRRLSRAVGGEARARGYLELMWDTAYVNGDEFLGDSSDVESAAHWDGKPGELTTALLTAGGEGFPGFIEEHPEHSGLYRVHDLFENAPEYVQKRMERELRRKQRGVTISDLRREAGKRGRALQLSGQTAASVGQTADSSPESRASIGQVSGKCRANGDTPAPAPAPAPAPVNTLPQTAFADDRIESSKAKNGGPTDEQVEQIYSLYPKKRDKLAAKKAIRKAVSVVTAGDADHPAMSIIEALDYLAKRIRLYSECTRGVDRQFIPYPASWFNAGSFWDDEKDWSAKQPPRQNGDHMKLPPTYVPASARVRQEIQQRSAGGVQ